MTKPTRSTIRYAAKQAYQLDMMTGKRISHVCGLMCIVRHRLGVVDVLTNPGIVTVPIAKSWINL